MVNGSLKNKVTASSWISYVYHPNMAFLNSSSAWCAKNRKANQYIQVCSHKGSTYKNKNYVGNETMTFINI